MKSAQQIYETYMRTGNLVFPQEPAVTKGAGPANPGSMTTTFADGSVLYTTVRRHLTGIAAGRDSVHIHWENS